MVFEMDKETDRIEFKPLCSSKICGSKVLEKPKELKRLSTPHRRLKCLNIVSITACVT